MFWHLELKKIAWHFLHHRSNFSPNTIQLLMVYICQHLIISQQWDVKSWPIIMDHQDLDCQLLMVRIYQQLIINCEHNWPSISGLPTSSASIWMLRKKCWFSKTHFLLQGKILDHGYKTYLCPHFNIKFKNHSLLYFIASFWSKF